MKLEELLKKGVTAYNLADYLIEEGLNKNLYPHPEGDTEDGKYQYCTDLADHETLVSLLIPIVDHFNGKPISNPYNYHSCYYCGSHSDVGEVKGVDCCLDCYNKKKFITEE